MSHASKLFLVSRLRGSCTVEVEIHEKLSENVKKVILVLIDPVLKHVLKLTSTT